MKMLGVRMPVVVLVCAMLASVAFAQEGSAQKAADLPMGPGLAAKYPGDRGIGADPNVVFAEDFEDEGLRDRGWYDLNGWGERLVITDEDQATGKRCIKLIYPKGSTGPWFRAPHFDHGYETLHVRYYRKWEQGWDWSGPGDGNGHDTRLVANGPELADQAYKDQDMVVLMMESAKRAEGWKRGYFGLMLYSRPQYRTPGVVASQDALKPLGHRPHGGEFWFAPKTGTIPPAAVPGRWYCVEYMAKMNAPGKADGEIACWIDGEVRFHIRNLMIRDGGATNVTWRRWWVGPYFHGGTTKEQASYVDSVVVATEYIGTRAPASPKQ